MKTSSPSEVREARQGVTSYDSIDRKSSSIPGNESPDFVWQHISDDAVRHDLSLRGRLIGKLLNAYRVKVCRKNRSKYRHMERFSYVSFLIIYAESRI